MDVKKIGEYNIKDAVARSDISSHITSGNNPHGVTKSQIGLGNVNNTADSTKSVKYATTAGSAGSATRDSLGNTISSFYAPLESLQGTNAIVTSLQTSLQSLTNSVSALSDRVAALETSLNSLSKNVTNNANKITIVENKLSNGRLAFSWTGTQLNATVDNSNIGKVTLVK